MARVDTGAVARRMVDRFRTEIDAYRRLPAETVRGPIADISRHNLELFFTTLLEQREPREDELGPFRESARRRAAEGLPLEDLLHAYRLGGRLGWEALIEAASTEEQAALLGLVASLMSYVDRVSDVVTETYHDERRHLMSSEERRLLDLFDAIVNAAPLDADQRELAGELGLSGADGYRPFAVTLAGASVNAHSQLAASVRSRGVFALTEGERLIGLLSAKPASVPVADPRALIVFGDVVDASRLEEGLEDVRLVLDVGMRLGRSGELRADECLAELLLARSPRAAAAIRRHALGPLEDASVRRSADLLDTLEVFFACDLDRRAAAERLHVHPNTLDYRLRRIEEMTDLDLQRPDDLLLVALALKHRLLGPPVRTR